jgi:hypothetical protein
VLALAAFLLIAAGAFEPFYFRIFAIDRPRLRASLTELPYQKLPGLRRFLNDVAARTRDGEVVAIYAPFAWDQGYEYAYARALYPLAGRQVVTFDQLDRATTIAAFRSAPTVLGFTVIWRSADGTLLRREQ